MSKAPLCTEAGANKADFNVVFLRASLVETTGNLNNRAVMYRNPLMREISSHLHMQLILFRLPKLPFKKPCGKGKMNVDPAMAAILS